MKKIAQLIIFACLATSFAYAQEPASATKGVNYGEQLNAENAISVALLAVKMENTDSLNTKISGKVAEVCMAKGCWMKLETGEGKTTMVTFKDYAFFMPKDIVGKSVVLDGFSKKVTTSIDEQKHYAEDAGKSKEEIAKITVPKNEIKYEAKGVLVL
jgi:hypothetical protein